MAVVTGQMGNVPIIGQRVKIEAYPIVPTLNGMAEVYVPAGGAFVGLSWWKGDKVAWVLANTGNPKAVNTLLLYQCGTDQEIPPELVKGRLSPLGQFALPAAGKPEWPLEQWFVFTVKDEIKPAAGPKQIPLPIPIPGAGQGLPDIPIPPRPTP